MNWNDAIYHVIDFRSFSSIWYWIVVAVLWSSVSYWVLGIPFDIIQRANRDGGQTEIDLVDLVRINVNRMLNTAAVSGIWLIGFAFFMLSLLASMGFYYKIEMAQALFLMFFPLSFVGALSVSTARLIAATAPEGKALFSILIRHRRWTQAIGMSAIFFSGLYGMYQNLSLLRGL